MAPSDSDYDPSTPPPAPAKRTRKRTVKALDALQQLPTTRAVPGRPIQIEGRATALPLPQNDEPNSTQQHPAHYELPPFPTRHIVELQETIGSLRAQLDTLSIEPPSTQTWASVAASGQPARAGTILLRLISTGLIDKENVR
ncbi:uncharacterized protein BDZ99DRAFT_462145, partial [Mytilinidion resinicola]